MLASISLCGFCGHILLQFSQFVYAPAQELGRKPFHRSAWSHSHCVCVCVFAMVVFVGAFFLPWLNLLSTRLTLHNDYGSCIGVFFFCNYYTGVFNTFAHSHRVERKTYKRIIYFFSPPSAALFIAQFAYRSALFTHHNSFTFIGRIRHIHTGPRMHTNSILFCLIIIYRIQSGSFRQFVGFKFDFKAFFPIRCLSAPNRYSFFSRRSH